MKKSKKRELGVVSYVKCTLELIPMYFRATPTILDHMFTFFDFSLWGSPPITRIFVDPK